MRLAEDKYGVSWQIVPSVLGELLQDKDAGKSKKVMDAMLQMNKIDIEGLKAGVQPFLRLKPDYAACAQAD